MVRLLVIDCFDSFVYNLVQILREWRGCTFCVCRADAIPLDALAHYDALLLSPGPGVPGDLPLLGQTLELCAATHHILGVCLGHQAIALHFGARLRQLSKPLHGHTDQLVHTEGSILRGLPQGASIGRYHSWVVDECSLPPCLQVLGRASSSPEEIMALRHRDLPIYGLQFHPESMMTHRGERYIHNFLEGVARGKGDSLSSQK